MKSLICLLAANAQQSFEAKANGGKCHVLALSSGDEASVYQAGAIAGLVNASAPGEASYDAISGVSGGALNTVILASFAKGDEKSAVDKLHQFWTDAGKTDLYKDWFGGVVRGLFFEGGIYNSKPLEDFLKKEFANTNIQRAMDIGITNVVDGSYVDFSDKNVTQGGNLVDALYASMSFAGFFPPADVLGSYYFDGSAVWDIDIFSAINRCVDQGFDESDIVVDVIMTSASNLKDVDATNFTSIQMLFRYLEISSFYNSMDGFLRAKFAYSKANFRHLIAPTGSIGASILPMHFDEKHVDSAWALGFKDALAAVNSTTSIDDMIHYHALKKSGAASLRKHTLGSFKEAKKNGEFGEYDIYSDPFMAKYTVKASKK